MAKVSYIELPPELKDSYNSALMPNDRFVFSRIVIKRRFLSRKRKLDLKERSLFGLMSDFWKTFSNEEKDLWRDSAAQIGLTGWQLFIQDQAARLSGEIDGFAVPSLLHQSWVGKIGLDDFSDELFLIQIHPKVYWISKKVSGTKSQFEPVKITEDFRLPLQLSINYKSELESGEGDFEACFFADVWYSYQGVDHFERLKIDFDLVSDWKNANVTLSNLQTTIIGYNLFFYFKNVKGKIYFDNIKAIHSGQNWVRDFACRNLTQIFPRSFYQVPAHWFLIEKTEGADFDSVYRDFN